MVKLYTVNEVAQILRSHRQHIGHLIRAGKLKAFRRGLGSRSPWLIHENSLDLFMKQMTLETMKGKEC